MSGPDIEGALSAHSYAINYRAGSICACGFVPTVDPETLATQQDYHRAHVAAILREQIDGALAEAWEEGATKAGPSYMATTRGADNPYHAAHLSDTERAADAE